MQDAAQILNSDRCSSSEKITKACLFPSHNTSLRNETSRFYLEISLRICFFSFYNNTRNKKVYIKRASVTTNRTANKIREQNYVTGYARLCEH